MTPEFLMAELDRAEDAELQSDEQLRQLTDLIDKTSGSNPTMNASDCAKVVTAALALNAQLRTRADKLRSEARMVAMRAEADTKNAQHKEATARMLTAIHKAPAKA
jgi:hypothetical protein